MKTQGKEELLQNALLSSLDQIRKGLLSYPLGIGLVITHVFKAMKEHEQITLKSLNTSEQELTKLNELAFECWNEENSEERCKIKLRKIYPKANTMIAQA